MTEKGQRQKTFLPLFVSMLILVSIAAVGCKTKPQPVTTTPEPPAVESSPPPEPVKEQPMKPAVEEAPAPARSMTADEYNRQGILKTVYFDFDKYEVRPDMRPTLEANAGQLKGQLSAFSVVLEGYCDERGTSEYNMTLGDRRANAIKQYLVSLGVPASRIRVVSYGEERPADPGHNEQAWARNRRVEFVLEEG